MVATQTAKSMGFFRSIFLAQKACSALKKHRSLKLETSESDPKFEPNSMV